MKNIKVGTLNPAALCGRCGLYLALAALACVAALGQQTATVTPGTPVGNGVVSAATTPTGVAKSAATATAAAVPKAAQPAVSGTPAVNGMGTPSGMPPAAAGKETASGPANLQFAGRMGLEGLKVHGHWTIDIRNPDGSLAQHRDFENSLNVSGGALLVGLLSGQVSPGSFMVALGPSGNGPCVGATYQWCALVVSTSVLPGSFYCATDYTCAATLTETANYGTAPVNGPYSLTLAGSITANANGSIGSVYTIMNTCGSPSYNANTQNPSQLTTVLPTACLTTTGNNALFAPLTNTNITAIPVANGQLIQVQVVISFS